MQKNLGSLKSRLRTSIGPGFLLRAEDSLESIYFKLGRYLTETEHFIRLEKFIHCSIHAGAFATMSSFFYETIQSETVKSPV